MPSFFDKPFAEQLESIIKTGDLKLMQALIGIRSPIGLLQYCSSFFITKINIMQAKCQAENRVLRELLKYYLEIIEKTGFMIENVTQHLDTKLEEAIAAGKDNLKLNKAYLPIAKNEYKFLVDSESSNLKAYINETNIGSLCVMDINKITKIYENFIKNFNLKEILVLNLKGDLHIILARLKDYISNLESKLKVFKEELVCYSGSLKKIKDGSFFDEWYKNLVYQVSEDAEKNKKHLLYNKIKKYKQGNSSELNDYIKNTIKTDLRVIWNKELVSRTFEEVIKNLVIDKNHSEEAIKKLLNLKDIDLRRDDILNCILTVFEKLNIDLVHAYDVGSNELKSKDQVFQYIVNNFVPSFLIKAEQSILNEMLLCAVKTSKMMQHYYSY